MFKPYYLVLVAALVACRHDEPNYCADQLPDHNCAEHDAATDGADGMTGCINDTQCSVATPVCDTATKICVECTTSEASECTSTTPVCKADACVACTVNADCSSSACLPDGSCGDDSNVAYVDPGGTDNTTCTKATPCTKVSKALATTRPYVNFHGSTDEAVTVNAGRHVTFLADPGAAITRSVGVGAIITVADDSTVLQIFDLTIRNAPNNSSGFGIAIQSASGSPSILLQRATISNNPGGGVTTSSGTLTVKQSTIIGNAGGGISLSATSFDLQNNVITNNGSGTTVYGGILISQLGSGAHNLAFNTIANNVAQTGFTSGATFQLISAAVTFSNNIIYGNTSMQVAGTNVSNAYSDIGPDAAAGTGNISTDPQFVNAAQKNYHILSGSPCKDAADPAASLAVDIDGDARPQGLRSDIGADEYKP